MKRQSRIGTLALLGAVVVVLGCRTTNALVGQGDACFLASDCQPGLICVEQRNANSICTGDLTGVLGDEPPNGVPDDADVPDRRSGSGRRDSGTQDGSNQGPSDPPDTGADAEVDAGSSVDAALD